MKTKSILKVLFRGTVIFTLAALISSCKKDDIDDSGSANLKVVNASPTSTPQSFYLAGQAVVQGGLSYGNASDYIITNSGNNLEAQFRNEGSSTAYADDRFDIDNGKTYTVFLAGEGQSARVQLYQDDLTAPAGGQVKVRFIHLSDAAPDNVDIRRSSGDNLVTNLGRNVASNYVSMAPGILSLQVFAAGQSTALGNFDLSAFLPDKIYTVFITGTAPGSIAVNQIVHN